MTSHIIHVITGLGVGGAEMVLYSFLSGLDVNDRQNHVVVCLGENDKIGDKISALGVKVQCLNMPKGRPTFKGLSQLIKIFRNFKRPIIQGWLYHGNLAASCAALLSCKPFTLYWSIHNSLTRIESEKSMTRKIIYALGYLSFLPKKIIYVAKLSAAQHENIGYSKSRTLIIPNGYNTTVFNPDAEAPVRLRTELKLPADAKLIGVVGRWDWSKDYPNFLSALAMVEGAHAVLMGTDMDAQNSELVAAIQAAGVMDRIHLLGYRDDVPKLVPGLDVLCLSSRAEALPNVVGEAMACGVPCVVTNVGDVAELVAETGWVCEPQNPESLANGLRVALASDLRNRSVASRRRIEEFYSYSDMIKAYKNLYDVKD